MADRSPVLDVIKVRIQSSAREVHSTMDMAKEVMTIEARIPLLLMQVRFLILAHMPHRKD
jgi:hypothetical protein